MKLLATADWHISFRQFDKLSPDGINAREKDVATTAMRAVQQMIAERPDMILVGGDVFHSSRPSNNAILFANHLFRTLREGVGNIPIIVVAGNHDAPRSADAGCILPLFAEHDITVVQNAVQDFVFPHLDCYVKAVPDVIGIDRGELRPSGRERHRVLLMHGEIAGMMAVATPHEMPVEDLHADEWSYIALGHYHVYRQVAPRAYYSGSIDYTSTNVWGELQEEAERGVPGKGFIVHDLETGTHRFVPIAVTRAFVELDAIDCAALTVEEIDAAIRVVVETVPGGIDGRVVRVVLRDMPSWRRRELNQQMLREFRLRALNFQVVTRAPETQGLTLDVRTPERRSTLQDTLAEFLTAYAIEPEIKRDAFVASGLKFFGRAGEQLAAVAVED